MTRSYLLCVDDERILLESLKRQLRREFSHQLIVEIAESGEEALGIVRQILSDGEHLLMVICDENMPQMKGHTLLAEIRRLSPVTALVLLSGYADLDALRDAINVAGLYRYLSKPWNADELNFTIRQAQKHQEQQRTITDQRGKIGRLTRSMIFALETANQNSDEDTDLHIERVSEYSALIAQRTGQDPEWVDRIRLYAGLHDIGKVGVACQLIGIDRYTEKERELQRLHVRYGGQILSAEGIDPMAGNIARFHHERWDGRGYLDHLVGEAIPFEARIVAFVDVFDALSSARPYRETLPFDRAFDQVLEMSGTWFDPAIVSLARECREEFRQIRDKVTLSD